MSNFIENKTNIYVFCLDQLEHNDKHTWYILIT